VELLPSDWMDPPIFSLTFPPLLGVLEGHPLIWKFQILPPIHHSSIFFLELLNIISALVLEGARLILFSTTLGEVLPTFSLNVSNLGLTPSSSRVSCESPFRPSLS